MPFIYSCQLLYCADFTMAYCRFDVVYRCERYDEGHVVQ